VSAKANQINKRIFMPDRWDIVKYQWLTHCYLYKIPVSDADLDCLTFLSMQGEQELSSFCNKAYEKGIFSSTQSVRNSLTKSEKKKLIVKEGKNKKKIYVNPQINIQTKGNVILDFEFLSIEAPQS
jgi:hypothetical protein